MTRRGVASTPPWPEAGLSETSPVGGLRMLTSTWMANATASVLRLTKAPSHSTLASVQLRVVNPEPRAPSEPAPFQLGGFRVPPVEASSCCGKRHGWSTPTPPAGQKRTLTCSFSLQPQRDSNPCRHLERVVAVRSADVGSDRPKAAHTPSHLGFCLSAADNRRRSATR
jgi:hypothetical protein